MLTLIVLLPLLGFLLNGVLATQLGGNRVGKPFVTVVGCGLPILAFVLTVKALLDLQAGGYAPIVETAYRWALIGRINFEVAFYFDRLAAVMTLDRHRRRLGDPHLLRRLHGARQELTAASSPT